MSCHRDLFELLLFLKEVQPPCHHPSTRLAPLPPTLSLSLPRFVTPSSTCLLPLRGETLLSHHPAADRHAKVVLWVIASLTAAVCLCTLAALL